MASENINDGPTADVALPGCICDDEESTQGPLFVMDWRSLIPQPMVNKIDQKLQKRSAQDDKTNDEKETHHYEVESEQGDSSDESENTASSEENEEQMDKKYKKMRKKLAREFIHKTTLHGVNYMSNPDHSSRRRSLWAIIFLIMFASFVVSSWLHFLEFVAHPVKSVISLEEQTRVTFPALTLCNINTVRKSFLEDEAKPKSAEHHLLRTVLEDMHGFTPARTFRGLSSESFDENRLCGLNMTLFIEEGAHKMEEMLISCTWKGIECTETYFKVRWTNFGYCYTFNEPDSGDPDYVTKRGRNEQLYLALNVQQHEYVAKSLDGAVGFVLILHEQGDVPLVYDLGFLASPGFLTQVTIKKKVRTSLEYPFPTKCRKAPIKYYGGDYTISKCVTSQEMDALIRRCGCTMPYMPKQDFYPLCDAYQMLTCYDILTKPKHTCDRPCYEVIYDESISMTIAPSLRAADNYEKQLGVNFSDVMANLVQLSLFYEDLSVEKTSEVQAYDFKDLTGGIGGELGLFLGASLITIVEFVDFIIKGKYYEGRFLRKWFSRTKARLQADTSSRWPWWLRIINCKTWSDVSSTENATAAPGNQMKTLNEEQNCTEVHGSSCVWYVEPSVYQPSMETLTTTCRFLPRSPTGKLEEFLPQDPNYPTDFKNVT